ncbi:RPA-interacting protein isoform X3 [Cebus imitator]|uniref:RPA-interacting protein isoform X3 n=1 Tax=Cebus imitator TaxID=2715852 RepID=UPI00189968D7|nr:RPA-interacting protein isoform X3 [Cebus imitator]
MLKCVSTWGQPVRQHFPEYPAIQARSTPENYNSQGSVCRKGAGLAPVSPEKRRWRSRRGLRAAHCINWWARRLGKRLFGRCLERMKNSRDRVLNRYRQAGSSTPGKAQNTFLVQEVMEEEWNALQSVENCPEDLAQLEELIDMAVLEEIQQELIEQEQSIISEYEKSLQFDEKCLSVMLAEWEANPLICPVCTKFEDPGLVAMMLWDPNSASRYNLRITGGVVVCQCGLSIPSHACDTWAVIL